MAVSNTKILLVEHNDFIKDALQRALEIEGYDVLSVATAMEGMKIVKREPFDAVIADYELPNVNGVEFFLLLERYCPGNVKILMTTYGELKTLTEIYKYGIDDAIEKPFPFERLVTIIEESLRKKSAKKRGQVGG